MFTTCWLVRLIAIGSLSLVVGFATKVHGQVISAGPGPLANPPAVFPVAEDPSAQGQFRFESPSSPASVQFDPAAGPFVKQLTPIYDRDSNGVIDLNDINAFVIGSPYILTEYIRVAPNDPWIGWYEEVATPGWEWGPVSFTAPNTPSALTGLTVNYGPGNQSVDFSFDPLAVGVDLVIRKELVFTGPVSAQMTADWFNQTYVFEVLEYPRIGVPEPCAATLAGFALFGLVSNGWRRLSH